MVKTAIIHARTESKLKNEVERIFKSLVLTTTQAVNLFFRQVKICKGLPFQAEIPNMRTSKTFRESEQGLGLITCKDSEDMFRRLGIG
jgi:DNA-damage-inducible protein J